MDCTVTKEQLNEFLTVVLPDLRDKLADDTVELELKRQLFEAYLEVLRFCAVNDFAAFNEYLEIDEDKTNENRGFFYHRKESISEISNALNDMEIHDAYDTLLISCPPRVGKMQPLDSGILTPSGWVKMGDLNIGSDIIGSDGGTYQVTGIFPHKNKDVYVVEFDDGTKVECGLEHLWTVQTRDDRRLGKERVVTTEDMLQNLYVENGKRKNYSIRYVEAVEFNNKLTREDLDPYLVGCLIGDGCLSGGVKFTNVDDELLHFVSDKLPATDVMKRSGNTISYNIVNREIPRNELGHPIPCTTQKKLKEYGLLGTVSDTKFIPEKYLFTSVENRLELIRGLMDTDSYVGGTNSYCEYNTVSKTLCENFVELVRSLGGRATVSTRTGSYKKDGVSVKCKTVYRIVFNLCHNPFKISRKASKFVPRTTRSVKYIKSIEKSRTTDCQCIMVNSEDHLYVTDGYNLTHNTTLGIRFLAWIIGRHPENTQLAISYSDSITTSFYIGVMEIVQHPRFMEVFPDSKLVNQNAKREEIWLKVFKRYPSISFVPINGSMTGRAEAGNYLYCDDLVSGIEEAMSPTRMDKLWQTYSVNARQRKKSGCKEIHIATRWSVNDPMSRLEVANEGNPRFKSIRIPCVNEEGESNFDFVGGFTKEYYEDQRNSMDEISFGALYMQDPVEREGLLYHKDELQFYFELPNEKPDAIIAVCDSKNLGSDNVASPIGYVYGDFVYVEDVVYNNGLPEVTRPLVVNKWIEHKVTRGDVEMNNGGNYYAEELDKQLRERGAHTSVRMFFSSNNKMTKIVTYSDFIKKHFIFKASSTYSKRSEYAKFMADVYKFTQTGNNKHDDCVDSLAMLAQLYQDLSGLSIKILKRKELGI